MDKCARCEKETKSRELRKWGSFGWCCKQCRLELERLSKIEPY